MDKSVHFLDMLHERAISEEWIDRALSQADLVEEHSDHTRRYLKQIPEYGDRWLRVVVNVTKTPNRCVTAFFDRRLRKKL